MTESHYLAQGLLAAVHEQGFGSTPDNDHGGAPAAHFPSIDLAVAAFGPRGAARWANVLFSREHPHGLVACIGDEAGAVQGIRFDADQQDARGDSVVWARSTDWQRLKFTPLHGNGPLRVVAPYPASLLKLMVAVGVGHIHMTAWDTVRLLWLLDGDAPPPPWLPAGTQLLQPATRAQLRGVLAHQQLDEILSSGSLRGVPGWVAGLPDAPAFAHKTGTTDNYASDAGISRMPHATSGVGTHFIVAVLTSLGRRYAPHARCATTWRLPALGATLHQLVKTLT